MISTLIDARRERRLQTEATALEDALGFEAAVIRIRGQILSAGRPQRRRLYRLHDAIARRHRGADGPQPLVR
jgi:hypothetical protein